MVDLFKSPSPRSLRPHQEKAISLLRHSLGRGNRSVVLQAPTGFGKTITSAKIIQAAQARGHRVLFTVPRLSLVDQAVNEFEKEGLTPIGVIQGNHPRHDPSAPLQVASVQTLARRSVQNDFGLVMVDECHEAFKVIYKLLSEWSDTHFVGLSATPWTKGLGKHWDDLAIAATIGDLIDSGFLSRFTVYAPSAPNLTGARTRAGDYAESDLEKIMGEGKLVASVVDTWLSKGEDRPTLLFGVNRLHAAMLQAKFQAVGIAAGYCDAYTDTAERKLIERQFRSGEIKIACSVRTLTTGIDWPVSCIIDAAPTKSEMLHVQKIGRGLRINPGTEDCLILDHAGNSLRLGLVTDIYHGELDDGEKRDKAANSEEAAKLPKPCPQCEVLFSGLECPACGYVRQRPPSDVEEVEGELVQLGHLRGRHGKSTLDDKQKFYSMALWVDEHRGKGGKLALALFKNKFGVWPRALSHETMPPDRPFLNYEKSRRIAYAKAMAAKKEAAA